MKAKFSRSTSPFSGLSVNEAIVVLAFLRRTVFFAVPPQTSIDPLATTENSAIATGAHATAISSTSTQLRARVNA